MIKFKIDQTDSAILRQTAQGLEAQRTASISGITNLKEALEHPNLPHVGHRHPQLENLVVKDITAKHNGPDTATITINYHNPSGSSSDKPQVKVGSALRSQTTETDLAGNRITVAYSASGNDKDLTTQGSRVSVLRSQTELSFARVESIHPALRAKKYAGTINRTTIFEGVPGTWLCTSISGKSDDGGLTFLTTYLFQYNESGWQPIISYTDPKTNRPPADLVAGIGIKVVTLYREEDFKNLGLGT